MDYWRLPRVHAVLGQPKYTLITCPSNGKWVFNDAVVDGFTPTQGQIHAWVNMVWPPQPGFVISRRIKTEPLRFLLVYYWISSHFHQGWESLASSQFDLIKKNGWYCEFVMIHNYTDEFARVVFARPHQKRGEGAKMASVWNSRTHLGRLDLLFNK